MFTVSQTAINAAIRDIQNGVTYPDFWENRYSDNEEQQEVQTEEQEKKEETTQVSQQGWADTLRGIGSSRQKEQGSMLGAIIITTVITAIVTASLMYFKIVRPLAEYAQCLQLNDEKSSMELARMQRVCSDIVRWVEIEATPRTAQAIKQRIAERLQQ